MKTKTILSLIIFLSTFSIAQEKFNVSQTIDLVSRYIWRGIDIASTPSAQPSISLSFQNVTLGFWGAYTLSNQTSASDEIDIWFSYNFNLRGVIITPLVTDYYYPNGGRSFFNFKDGTGAHLLEAGLKLYKENFPVIISGYYNFYNDPGNNTYFELLYSAIINEIKLDSFLGIAGGSKENSLIYNTENINFINIGIRVTKSLVISEEINIPIFVSFIINPRNEKGYITAGLSL